MFFCLTQLWPAGYSHRLLGRSHTFCPKCGAKVGKVVAQSKEHRRVRALPLDSETLGMLREYIDKGGPVTRNGRRLIFGTTRHQAWRVVRDCANRVGLGDLERSAEAFALAYDALARGNIPAYLRALDALIECCPA